MVNRNALNHDGLIVLDVETTGLSDELDEILTLSICDGYGKVLFDKRFKPTHKTSWPEAERVNGISPESVKDCPCISECLEEIQAIIDNADEILGYNVGFDLNFLESAGVDIDRKKYKREPMCDFAEVYGQLNDYGDYKWQKLTTAADYIEYDWEGVAHTSMADVLATLNLAEWLYDEGNYTRVIGERHD